MLKARTVSSMKTGLFKRSTSGKAKKAGGTSPSKKE